MKAIGEVTKPVSTWNPAKATTRTEFSYIDLSAIDNVRKEVMGATRVASDEAPSRARQLVAAGDVLVSTVRPNLNAVAVVPPELDGATASTGFTVLRPADDIEGRYLFHWVRSRSFVADMMRKATGASYPAVSDRIVKSSVLPLPAREEQRRIATTLDEADNLLAKRQQAVALIEELQQSIFFDMFGRDMATRQRVPLKSMARVITKGTTPTSVGLAFAQSGVPFLRVQNLIGGTVRFGKSDLFIDDSSHQSLRRSVIHPGDLLVSIAGTIGRCAIVPQGLPEMNCNQAVAIVRLLDDAWGPCLMTWLSTPDANRQIGASAVTATISNLSLAQLGSLQVPSFRDPEIVEFNRRLRSLNRLLDSMKSSSTGLDLLADALQDRAFGRGSGEDLPDRRECR